MRLSADGRDFFFTFFFLLFLEYSLGFGVPDLVGSGKIISPARNSEGKHSGK